jgi:hypothetical protein
VSGVRVLDQDVLTVSRGLHAYFGASQGTHALIVLVIHTRFTLPQQMTALSGRSVAQLDGNVGTQVDTIWDII